MLRGIASRCNFARFGSVTGDGANVAQELSGSSPIANLLSGGVDEVFTRTDSVGTANFLTDALGSPINMTNSSGSSLAQYVYEPFGNTTLVSGSSTNSYEYTGRENDGTGLYFYRARYYSPTLQRFISEDPIGLRGGINFYAYTSNDPTLYVDSFGVALKVEDVKLSAGPPHLLIYESKFGKSRNVVLHPSTAEQLRK